AAFGTNAPAAVPYLIQIASSHSNDDARYIAAFTIRTMGSAAEPAIPFLIQCLTNQMNTIRDEAALALGYLHLQPEVVVPALTDYLNAVIAAKAFGWEFQDAVASLSEFGTNATRAVPTLLALLNHSNPAVRSQVTNALGRIEPAGDWTHRANP
ncbi:MAG TPA: HEAT repeat domain-containing protein, partial [Methylomirabilota bacterium]|nr:HEAT repeat domain-containing protein [Methylomirabilota bacterium]